MANFSVEVYDQNYFERSLRKFGQKTKKSGILREIKKKRFYTKPSVQKKLDLARSVRRQKKAERLANMSTAERAQIASRGKQNALVGVDSSSSVAFHLGTFPRPDILLTQIRLNLHISAHRCHRRYDRDRQRHRGQSSEP